jgi:leucyl aminopeptidase
MDEMKYDMSGAASVLGTMRAGAEMKLQVNLTIVVPAVENMPAHNASKPGDVVNLRNRQQRTHAKC